MQEIYWSLSDLSLSHFPSMINGSWIWPARQRLSSLDLPMNQHKMSANMRNTKDLQIKYSSWKYFPHISQTQAVNLKWTVVWCQAECNLLCAPLTNYTLSPLAAAHTEQLQELKRSLTGCSAGMLLCMRFSIPDNGRKVPVQMSTSRLPALLWSMMLRLSVPGGRASSVTLAPPFCSKASLWWRTPAGLPRGFQQPWIVDQIWLCGVVGSRLWGVWYPICRAQCECVKREDAWQLENWGTINYIFFRTCRLCSVLWSRSCWIPFSIWILAMWHTLYPEGCVQLLLNGIKM